MSDQKTRILLIDDEPAFTGMLRRNLEMTGQYNVREENDPISAIRTAKAFDPHLIFLDVVMLELEGGDVASALRSDPNTKNVPIVFLTALVEGEEANIGGLVSGGHRFIPKPASVAEIIGCINQTLGGQPPNPAHPTRGEA